MYSPSAQQQAVLDWIDTDTGNLNLIARAGCGKTSTLKMLAHRLATHPTNTRGFWLGAYNSAIAEELKTWLKGEGFDWQKVQAGTWHSLGFRAWMKLAQAKVEGNKVRDLVDEAQIHEYYRDFVIHAVSLAKQRAFGVLEEIDDRKAWYNLIDHFGLEDDLDGNDNYGIDEGINHAIRTYKRSLDRCRSIIDYDDMILAPLFFKVRMWQFSYVGIDEAQDTNPARRALAKKVLAPGGRLIAVGDPCQAIYGFTGADSDSMDIIKAEMNSKELPLNHTYRCPQSVVRLAQTWVPDIQAAETNPEGLVRTIDAEAILDEEFRPTDAILCRKTAPIVELAYRLLARGVGCRVEGRKIGEGLAKLINRFKVKTIDALINRTQAWRDKETQKWLAKGDEVKAAGADDRAETILQLCESMLGAGKQNVSDILDFIQSMFKDTPEGKPAGVLTLCTIHKSKGREWRRVYLLGRNAYQPSKWARKAWQVEQEQFLMYVAVTRAMEELVEIKVKSEKRKETA